MSGVDRACAQFGRHASPVSSKPDERSHWHCTENRPLRPCALFRNCPPQGMGRDARRCGDAPVCIMCIASLSHPVLTRSQKASRGEFWRVLADHHHVRQPDHNLGPCRPRQTQQPALRRRQLGQHSHRPSERQQPLPWPQSHHRLGSILSSHRCSWSCFRVCFQDAYYRRMQYQCSR